MKNKIVKILGLVIMIGLLTSCGANNKPQELEVKIANLIAENNLITLEKPKKLMKENKLEVFVNDTLTTTNSTKNSFEVWVNNVEIEKVVVQINDGFANGGTTITYIIDKFENKAIEGNNHFSYYQDSNKISHRITYESQQNEKYVSLIAKMKADTSEYAIENVQYYLKNTLVNKANKAEEKNIIQHLVIPSYAIDEATKKATIQEKKVYKLRNGYRQIEDNQLFSNKAIEKNVKLVYQDKIYKNYQDEKETNDLASTCFISPTSKFSNQSETLLLNETKITDYLNMCKKEGYVIDKDNIVKEGYYFSDRLYLKFAKTKMENGKVAYYNNQKQTVSKLKNLNNTKFSYLKDFESYAKATTENRGNANSTVATRNAQNIPTSSNPQLSLYPSRTFIEDKEMKYDNSAWSYIKQTGKLSIITPQQLFHPGIDVEGFEGKKVRAAFEGKIIYAGTYNDTSAAGGFYNYVVVAYPGSSGITYRVTYAHLQEAPTLQRGAVVFPGMVLGISGNSGNSQIPHLHSDVEVIYANYSNYFNSSPLANSLSTQRYGNTGYMRSFSQQVGSIIVYRMHPETFYSNMGTN